MAELNEFQKESYNIYIGNNIEPATAEKLATGELSAADWEASQSKKPLKTEEQEISDAGYNVELIDKTKQEVKKKDQTLLIVLQQMTFLEKVLCFKNMNLLKKI